MYELNKLLHGKRFVRDFHTRWFSIRNLTRLISDTSPARSFIAIKAFSVSLEKLKGQSHELRMRDFLPLGALTQ